MQFLDIIIFIEKNLNIYSHSWRNFLISLLFVEKINFLSFFVQK